MGRHHILNSKPPRRAFRQSVGAALAALALTMPAAAQDAATGGKDTEILVTGYLFASALNGRASTTSSLPPANIDLSFGDVLDDLDFGFMTTVEMRRGRWGFMGDLMYSKVSPGGTVPGPLPLNASLEQRSTILQANALYRVHEDAKLDVDLGAGLRYWNIDNQGSVSLTGGGSAPFADNKSWMDPVVMARATARLGGPWSMTIAGDVGGFGAGSELTYQLLGSINYNKDERKTFRVGYRVLSVDYNKDGFVYDIRMQGPVVAMTFRF